MGTSLKKGFNLEATATIGTIQAFMNPWTPTFSPTLGASDTASGAPKVYTDPLPAFTGDPVDFEDWDRKAQFTIQ